MIEIKKALDHLGFHIVFVLIPSTIWIISIWCLAGKRSRTLMMFPLSSPSWGRCSYEELDRPFQGYINKKKVVIDDLSDP